MKKILAILLALCMVLSLSVAAAADSSNSSEADRSPVLDPDDGGSAGDGADVNPGTGIVLAVIPMIVAAAAIVVFKKR